MSSLVDIEYDAIVIESSGDDDLILSSDEVTSGTTAMSSLALDDDPTVRNGGNLHPMASTPSSISASASTLPSITTSNTATSNSSSSSSSSAHRARTVSEPLRMSSSSSSSSPPATPSSTPPFLRRTVDVLLSSKVRLNDKPFVIQLTAQSLLLCKPSSRSEILTSIAIADILTVKSVSESSFVVHTFPLKDKTLRRRVDLLFVCEDEGEKLAWVEEIASLLDRECKVHEERTLLVLANPFGGKKQAPTVWHEIVAPVFELVPSLKIQYQETMHEGHAGEIAKELELMEYDGIVTVSGDGLMHEVVNGLMNREDWYQAIKIPLGIVPAGSGNGLACATNGIDPTNAAFAIAKGYTRPLDLLWVSQASHKYFCILSVNWAIISDIDFDSERYRWMGGQRFAFTSVVKIADLKKYRARVSYLPAHITHKHTCSRGCEICRSELPPEALETHKQRVQAEKEVLERAFSGKSNEKAEEPAPAPQDSPKGYLDNPKRRRSIRDLTSIPATQWKTIESDFVLLVASNATHLSSDGLLAPYAHLSDGCVDLVMVRDCNRLEMVSIFLGFEDGSHVSSSVLEYQHVKAFILEPLTHQGCFGFDGEKAKDDSYLPIYCEVMRGAATIMAPW
eukprot:TRINITY_DN1977_c0_g2_i1.p1 TRINITY_DN1977_c0_g2~~TRINITY_DN1977_c0_g2_i1.p1  ORF type:complete len:622 (-),score=139.39 TRINITY_DN1977_c0_g2_i1:94-1959(-)